MKRPPIVVVMGHVDHGKTTLLDYIRETSVAAREAGGITQSIGAYEIVHNKERVTFIDTPGHEAFKKMRARGAEAADIAILVVAADDGVQPQTKEAIKIIRETETPFIVAINKIDKAGADQDKTKNELTQEGVLLEGYGGNVSYQPISAKTGDGVHELLDLILLTAEMEELDYDPAAPAKGFILESKLDSRKGIIATAIVKNGALKTGDEIVTPSTRGKIKMLENFLGKPVDQIIPSSPAIISGFENLPIVGEEFEKARAPLSKIILQKPTISKTPKIGKKTLEEVQTLSFIIKADTSGSLEIVSEIINNLPMPEKIQIEIIGESVGNVSDSDINAAIPTKALVIAFRNKVTKAAENLAKVHNIQIISSEIIYELIKAVEEKIKSLKEEMIKGVLEILAIFGKKGANQQIVGGKVIEGEIKNNTVIEIWRKEKSLGDGKIINLQHNKKDAAIVAAGKECGLLVDSQAAIQVGDKIISKQ